MSTPEYAVVSVLVFAVVGYLLYVIPWADVWAIVRGNRYEDLRPLENGRRER